MTHADFIENVLKEASEIALARFGKVEGRIKPEDSTQILTDTDIEIGKYLVGEVKKNYPSHNIIDEEAGVIDKGSEFTWVVDPIDGTANFAMGIVTYGTMIGLLENETSIAGGRKRGIPKRRKNYSNFGKGFIPNPCFNRNGSR